MCAFSAPRRCAPLSGSSGVADGALPRTVGLLGAGVIGAGWAARFVLHGVDVRLYDPDERAEEHVRAVIENARRAYAELMTAPLPVEGDLTVTASPQEAARDAGFVQESVPEREALKRDLIAAAGSVTPAGVVIASSTSGLLPSRLQAGVPHPERVVVGHPFHPVYLLPLVEVCGGSETSPAAVESAEGVYRVAGHVASPRAEGDRRVRGRPAARGPVARGAVAGRRRRGDGRRDRRRDPPRRRPQVVVHGHLPRLPHGRRRRGHARLPRALRPGARVAVDEAHRRAGADGRAGRPDHDPVRRAGGRPLAPRARARARRPPGRGAPGAPLAGCRRRQGAGGARGAPPTRRETLASGTGVSGAGAGGAGAARRSSRRSRRPARGDPGPASRRARCTALRRPWPRRPPPRCPRTRPPRRRRGRGRAARGARQPSRSSPGAASRASRPRRRRSRRTPRQGLRRRPRARSRPASRPRRPPRAPGRRRAAPRPASDPTRSSRRSRLPGSGRSARGRSPRGRPGRPASSGRSRARRDPQAA